MAEPLGNPLRSEAAMFRVFLVVGIAAIPVIVLGVVAGPAWGVAALVLELAAGVWMLWRRARDAGDA